MRRLQKMDFSANSIFDKGLEGICQHIGANRKSQLTTLKFSDNEVTDKGLKRLLGAIEKNVNKLEALHFASNELTDEGAFFLYNWLKKQRMRDVEHNLNIVTFDLSLNKILRKHYKDVEVQLAVNQKFQTERKNLEIATEVKIMKTSRIQLRHSHRKQRRYIDELKEVDEDLRNDQSESVVQKGRWDSDFLRTSVKLENFQQLEAEAE